MGPNAQQVGPLARGLRKASGVKIVQRFATLVSMIMAVVLPGNAAQAQIQSNEVKTLLKPRAAEGGVFGAVAGDPTVT